jgi:hypothetical protein
MIGLDTQRTSGINGTATLTDIGNGRTRVELRLEGASGLLPAYIHQESCVGLSEEARFPLRSVRHALEVVQNGTSATEVDAPLAELTDGELVIAVHRSASEIETQVACGSIPGVDDDSRGRDDMNGETDRRSGGVNETLTPNPRDTDVRLPGGLPAATPTPMGGGTVR